MFIEVGNVAVSFFATTTKHSNPSISVSQLRNLFATQSLLELPRKKKRKHVQGKKKYLQHYFNLFCC